MGNSAARPDRTAVHYLGPEVKRQIGGIDSVVRGWVSTPAYRRAFATTVLVGFDRTDVSDEHRRFETLFDSRRPADREWVEIAAHFGTPLRVAQGQVAGVDVLAVLVSPDGARRSAVSHFYDRARDLSGLDLRRFECYPAIEEREQPLLQRTLSRDPALRASPDRPLLGPNGGELYGGTPYLRGPDGDLRAAFPAAGSLDAFAGYEGRNRYVLELQAHTSIAAPAARALATLLRLLGLGPADATLFLHDALAIPFLWAALAEGFLAARAVYVAHETRLYRLLVEGVLWDKEGEIVPHCSLDAHDCGFYKHLDWIEAKGLTLNEAFPGNTFGEIYYHAFTCEAARCGRVLAVGENVAREMRVILGGPHARTDDLVRVCPNGLPAQEVSLDAVTAARARLMAFASRNGGFEPDILVTTVSRCELSKAAWRTIGFLERLASSEALSDARILLCWLSRPRRLPTAEEVREWARWGWPTKHRPSADGGDLGAAEASLWDCIRVFNTKHRGRCHVLYVNQFGWNQAALGALEPLESTFADLRTGTDVELGLAAYGPFEISPLEPFAAGAISVVSAACGCAAHLRALHRTGAIEDIGFVIADFTCHPYEPVDLTLDRLAEVEEGAYGRAVEELVRKLSVPRAERVRAAQSALSHLCWETVASRYLMPALP